MLEPVEEAFGEIALAVQCVTDGALHLAVARRWDMSPTAAAFHQIYDGAGIVASVGDQTPAFAQRLKRL